MSETDNVIQWIYSSRDNGELLERYNQWARSYDSDLLETEDYQAPPVTAEYFRRYVSKTARVLDAGAGTGLMGELLRGLGYEHLVAMDMSPGMLDEARKKNVYAELHEMVLDKDPKKRLEWIYGAAGARDLEERYDLWASEYDADVAGYGYKIPGVLADFLARYLTVSDGRILGAGAGTGIMGEVMSLLGYRDIVTMDMSEGMLELARQKDVYKELHRMVMGEHLDFTDNSFAGTTAVGVLSVGHAPPESFDELVRCTRSGGHIIFSVRADAEGFAEKQQALLSENKWRQVEATPPFVSLPLGEPNIRHRIFTYQVV